MKMEIQKKNCWQKAAICYLNPPKNGLQHKTKTKSAMKEYPELGQAYGLCHSLRMILTKNTIKDAARLSMAKWYNKEWKRQAFMLSM